MKMCFSRTSLLVIEKMVKKFRTSVEKRENFKKTKWGTGMYGNESSTEKKRGQQLKTLVKIL